MSVENRYTELIKYTPILRGRFMCCSIMKHWYSKHDVSKLGHLWPLRAHT